MEPSLLLILVFILAPLIEKLLKAGRQPPPDQQPPRRVPHRMPDRDRDAERPGEDRAPGRVVIARRKTEEESASTMLPDDLWEILTGEQRAPRRPERTFEVESADEEEEAYAIEEPRYEPEPGPETPVTVAEDVWVQPVPHRAAPEIVSLEALEFDDRRRHSQFHTRLEQLAPAATVERPVSRSYRTGTREDLRRAIIMAEILGRPKGL